MTLHIVGAMTTVHQLDSTATSEQREIRGGNCWSGQTRQYTQEVPQQFTGGMIGGSQGHKKGPYRRRR